MLRASAPAKVNLTIAVGPRETDGFHQLRSVFLRLGLADELEVELPGGHAGPDELAVGGDFECPVQGNLVLRAFQLVRDAVGQPLPPLRSRLTKHVPVGAGLAGGSSDGAAALKLAQAAWGVGLAPAVQDALGLTLGSDVPFFIHGGAAALVEGRGEGVTPLPAVSGGAGVLLSPSPTPLATARVYARFDDLGPPGPSSELITDELASALSAGLDGAALADMAGRLRAANDLWPAAAGLQPTLAARRDRLEQLTGRPWLMTGSGPTLLALYPSSEEAKSDYHRLSDERLIITSLA